MAACRHLSPTLHQTYHLSIFPQLLTTVYFQQHRIIICASSCVDVIIVVAQGKNGVDAAGEC